MTLINFVKFWLFTSIIKEKSLSSLNIHINENHLEYCKITDIRVLQKIMLSKIFKSFISRNGNVNASVRIFYKIFFFNKIFLDMSFVNQTIYLINSISFPSLTLFTLIIKPEKWVRKRRKVSSLRTPAIKTSLFGGDTSFFLETTRCLFFKVFICNTICQWMKFKTFHKAFRSL